MTLQKQSSGNIHTCSYMMSWILITKDIKRKEGKQVKYRKSDAFWSAIMLQSIYFKLLPL